MDTGELKKGSTPGTDEVLLQLLRKRDEAALGVLYDLRSRMVYSLALSIVGNVSDAEEVTQEVFFRVWERAKTFDRSRGSALAWLTTVTRRLAIDRTRSKPYKSRSRETTLEAVVYASPVTQGQGADEKIAASLQAEQVMAALNRLDPHHREIIRLSYFEGLSHTKIAERLGAPLGTVKSRLREAVAQLRRILDVKV